MHWKNKSVINSASCVPVGRRAPREAVRVARDSSRWFPRGCVASQSPRPRGGLGYAATPGGTRLRRNPGGDSATPQPASPLPPPPCSYPSGGGGACSYPYTNYVCVYEKGDIAAPGGCSANPPGTGAPEGRINLYPPRFAPYPTL